MREVLAAIGTMMLVVQPCLAGKMKQGTASDLIRRLESVVIPTATCLVNNAAPMQFSITLDGTGRIVSLTQTDGNTDCGSQVASSLHSWTFAPEPKAKKDEIAYSLIVRLGKGAQVVEFGESNGALALTVPDSTGTLDHILFAGFTLSSRARDIAIPPYPRKAQNAGVQGKVEVAVETDLTGAVVQIKTLSGDPLLRQSGEDTARKFSFRPLTVNGAPTRSIGILQFSWFITGPP